jgi:hypothetical protein
MIPVERVSLPVGALHQSLKVLASEEFLLNFAFEGGRQASL